MSLALDVEFGRPRFWPRPSLPTSLTLGAFPSLSFLASEKTGLVVSRISWM